MHQTPFACLVSPGGGAFEIFACYVLKVLKFFIFILFSFFKNNWIFSFFSFKNLEKKSGVPSPESSPGFILCRQIMERASHERSVAK